MVRTVPAKTHRMASDCSIMRVAWAVRIWLTSNGLEATIIAIKILLTIRELEVLDHRHETPISTILALEGKFTSQTTLESHVLLVRIIRIISKLATRRAECRTSTMKGL